MRLSLAAAALVFSATAAGQNVPSVSLDGLGGAAMLGALARECYEARLVPEMPVASILDCSAVIQERSLAAPDAAGAGQRTVVTHRVRFTLLERGDGRIGAEAWVEIEELGTVIEQPVTSQAYLDRVQRVLTAVAGRLAADAPPPWAGRYDSEQAWHLDAHLRAVSHCDAGLSSMTAESVGEELEAAGLYALGGAVRDRCEQLYTHLFEWGLARGDTRPTLAAYLRYRAALPPPERLCSGQLAPDARCSP